MELVERIDDYGKPDPIPPAMLRGLASAKFLNLFADEEEKEEAAARRPAAQLPRSHLTSILAVVPSF